MGRARRSGPVCQECGVSLGNASGKETIDRISGSGVFARDPDSLVMFTKHEEEGAYTVEPILRNFPPVPPFVVQWAYPLFRRDGSLDPTRLKQAAGRPAKYTENDLLECLGTQRLTTTQWKDLANEELGVSRTRFYELKEALKEAGKVSQSPVDEKWEQIRTKPRNYDNEEDA